MAVKKSGRTRKTVWQAHPDDAIRLAALRWFALEMERQAIEIYATDQTQYAAIERLFRRTLASMGRVKAGLVVGEEDGCPDGYERCSDGLCSPMCGGV